jgi:hypothetical protein
MGLLLYCTLSPPFFQKIPVYSSHHVFLIPRE